MTVTKWISLFMTWNQCAFYGLTMDTRGIPKDCTEDAVPLEIQSFPQRLSKKAKTLLSHGVKKLWFLTEWDTLNHRPANLCSTQGIMLKNFPVQIIQIRERWQRLLSPEKPNPQSHSLNNYNLQVILWKNIWRGSDKGKFHLPFLLRNCRETWESWLG